LKPLDLPLLADENIHPDVVRELKAQGRDIVTAIAEGLGGRPDADILRRAHAMGRVVLTHDSDFGRLAVQAGEPMTGVIYLRPGHVVAGFVIDMVAAIAALDAEVTPPFIVVADRRGDAVRVRIRSPRDLG
jgi:predicted nuclease of predicted toxin-antitoxin system